MFSSNQRKSSEDIVEQAGLDLKILKKRDFIEIMGVLT